MNSRFQIITERRWMSVSRRVLAGMLLLLLGAVMGCATDSPRTAPGQPSAGSPTENRLRVGDDLVIRLETGGTHSTGGAPDSLMVPLDENGEVSLPLIGRIKAENLTPSELAERIEGNYVPRFYVRCNITVQVAARYFYVGGEVRSPGRYNWSEDMTLLKAINTAGSFNDYANRRKVEVIRGKEKQVTDCEELRRTPGKDPAIRPGDSIWVPRSIF
jgi:protein involved in polysaccharide export with SLBB domain